VDDLAEAAFAVHHAVVMASRGPATPGASPDDSVLARAARERLASLIASEHRLSRGVLDAIREVPRHRFVDVPVEEAYRDCPLSIGWDQTISQPTIVAVMSFALELSGAERVLEIGTGSGYQAAVLSRLASRVDSIEIVAPLAMAAERRLKALGYVNVDVREGDGYAGWPERAPYDRILLTAAPPRIPDTLLEQLDEGGILVAPVGERSQRLMRWRKRRGAIAEDLGGVLFVPMVAKT
jgi:protein-L-isoaspartate(D-aspartate) O-methyltransferase